METIIGVALWAGIGYLVVRAVRKALAKRGEAAATATATAAAEGGAANGSGSAVTNIHFHVGAPAGDDGHDGEALTAGDDVAAALAVLARAAQAQQLEGSNVHHLGAGPAQLGRNPRHPAEVHRNGTAR